MKTQILNQGTQVLTVSTTETGTNWTGGLLRVHEVVSHWEIIEKLSTQSGEADIYLAQKDGEKGVVKYYRSKMKPRTEILEKIRGLNHPDIVNLYEFGYYLERFYEVMEYAAGGALDSRKKDGSYKYLPLSETQTVQVCREIINSYKTCHEKGIIHRDIKPANLYYRNPEGSDVVIGDFGISSIMEEMSKLHKTQTASRTTGYAAPEVLSGMITPKMDYYALGITLWELLTGKDPFTMDDGKRRNDAHLIRDTIEGRIADDILSREPQLSASMQRLIRGLLIIDPEHRWGYDEVTRHLDGQEVPVYQQKKKSLSFKIGDQICSSLEQIGSALIENPESTQRQVFRGMLGAYLEEDYPDIAKKITELAEESSANNDYYRGIMKIAYLLNPAVPFNLGNGFSASNIDEIVFYLENAPETMLPLLKLPDSKLYTYLEILGYTEQAEKIRKFPEDYSDIERIGKAAVILKNHLIKPFKLARYADFELSDLEQIHHVPKDMQNHILNLVSVKSYEGNFLSWLDLLTPDVSVDGMKTGSWKEFLESIGAQ
jgi:serine/threonine protein kinase